MAESDSVLRLKLAARSAPPPGRMSAEKALAIAFGRAGRDVPGLGLRMAGFARERVDLVDLAEAFEPGSLAMFLVPRGSSEAPDADRAARPSVNPNSCSSQSSGTLSFSSSRASRAKAAAPPEQAIHGGLLIADPGLLTALVEARMTGHVSTSAGPPRSPTRIDGLIVGGLVDEALTQFDLLVPDLSLAPMVSNWQVGTMVASAASAKLTLRDGLFICFTLDFDFAEGARQGRLVLAMPEAPPPAREAVTDDAAPTNLAQIVLQTRGDLRAILARMPVPLSRLSMWQPGHTIPIPRSALTGVRIEDIDGTLVGRGRLGQLSGARAVRITAPEAAPVEAEFALAPGPPSPVALGSFGQDP